MTIDQQKIWMNQWREAGVALENHRASELSAMTAEERLLIINRLVFLPKSEREETTGLVMQQRLFSKHRRNESHTPRSS